MNFDRLDELAAQLRESVGAKIVGEVPTSMAKVWSYGATLWALLTAMLALLYGILVLW